MEIINGWYVLYVKTKHERKIYETLTDMNIESYVPMYSIFRKWSDRRKKVELPLFTNYVLVNINSSMDFYRALSVNGVFCYIKFGNSYARVPENEIDTIKLTLGADVLTDVSIINEAPGIGEKYTIKYGPLAGLECEINKLKNAGRILVRIESLQKSIVATIPVEYIYSHQKSA